MKYVEDEVDQQQPSPFMDQEQLKLLSLMIQCSQCFSVILDFLKFEQQVRM